MPGVKIAVVGAGAAGLAAAGALHRGGAEVLIFEAEARVGGKIRTALADGFLCEDGPNSLTADSATAWRLVRESKLAVLSARPPHTRFVVRRGEMLPAPSSKLLSPAGWARLLAEPLVALLPHSRGDESLREFFDRHLGEEAGTLASTLLANGVYGGDPQLLSARAAFSRLVALEDEGRSLFVGGLWRGLRARRSVVTQARNGESRSVWVPAAGLSALSEALAERVRSSVRLSTPVEAVHRRTAGYTLALGGASRTTVEVDGLLCALPPAPAAALLHPLWEGLSTLAEVRSAPMAVVHLGFHLEDFARAPRGFGVLDGDGSLQLLGALFPSSLFEGRAPKDHALITCMVGGMRHPDLAGFDDAALSSLCREDLRRLLGVVRPPVFQRVARWPAAVPQPELGHAARIATARMGLRSLPPIELAGAGYDDGAAVDQVLQSGEAAAGRLLARLAGEVTSAPVAAAPLRMEA